MYDAYLSVPSGFFSDLDRVRGELDSLFGWGGSSRAIRSTAGSSYPAINVAHSPQAVDVYVLAPGIDASRTENTLDRDVLTIASDLPPEAPKTSVHGRERYSGKFRRAVALPDDVDPSQVSTTYLLPRVDVVEDSAGITLLSALPGVKKDGLDIKVDGPTLSLEGTVALDTPPAFDPAFAEVRGSRYCRSFMLSNELDTAAIDAQLKDGVLRLRIPTVAEAQPRRIEVRVG